MTLWGYETRGEWTITDRLLALAYTQWEKGLCSCGCGYPARIVQDPDADGWFEADDGTICHARAAIDRWNREHEKNRPPAGTLVGVRDTRPVEMIDAGSFTTT